mmetsp:Transcript_17893/g.50749  ORF Transcript_17893/g.50749 Transcript_17893/m.50749 type:complete len:418 (+) Transcript_17893:1128-2381(+)
MLDGCHDVLLADNSLHLVMADDLPLAKLLERVRRAGALVTDQPDLTERSDTQNSELDEVLVPDRLVEGVAHELQRLSESANIADDAFDVPPRQHSAFCVGLDGYGLLARRAWIGFQPVLSEVVGVHQRVDDAVGIGDDDAALSDDVEVLLVRLALLRKDGAGRERPLHHEVGETRHFVRLELRVGKDGHTLERALFHRVVDEPLQRPQDLLEGFAGEAQRRAVGHGRDVGGSGVAGEQRPLSEPVSRPELLVDVPAVPESDVVDLDLSFSEDVEDLTDITLVDDSLPLREGDGLERIGNAEEGRFVEVGEELDLAQDVVDVLLLAGGVVGQHVPERPLVDLPQPARRVGKAGGGTRAVVQQSQLTERATPPAGTHMVPVDREAHVSLVDDVEEIPNFALLDDDGSRRHGLHDHGIDE